MVRTGPHTKRSVSHLGSKAVSILFPTVGKKFNIFVLCDTMVREGRPCRALSSEQNVPCFSMSVGTRLMKGGR